MWVSNLSFGSSGSRAPHQLVRKRATRSHNSTSLPPLPLTRWLNGVAHDRTRAGNLAFLKMDTVSEIVVPRWEGGAGNEGLVWADRTRTSALCIVKGVSKPNGVHCVLCCPQHSNERTFRFPKPHEEPEDKEIHQLFMSNCSAEETVSSELCGVRRLCRSPKEPHNRNSTTDSALEERAVCR